MAKFSRLELKMTECKHTEWYNQHFVPVRPQYLVKSLRLNIHIFDRLVRPGFSSGIWCMSILNWWKQLPVLESKSWNAYTQGMYQVLFTIRSPLSLVVVFVRYSKSMDTLRSHLELPSLRHVLDAFERFVFLTIHVQSVHLQPCRGTEMQ